MNAMFLAEPIDASYVIRRLEDAGATLLALPGKGCLPAGMGSGWPDVVHEVVEAYGYDPERMCPPVPSAAAIRDMDAAFEWIKLLPTDRAWITRRRILLFRALVNPMTDRHRWPWPRIGKAFGLSVSTAQRWHADGVDLIVCRLQGVDKAWSDMLLNV